MDRTFLFVSSSDCPPHALDKVAVAPYDFFPLPGGIASHESATDATVMLPAAFGPKFIKQTPRNNAGMVVECINNNLPLIVHYATILRAGLPASADASIPVRFMR